jgi:tRNA U34 5-carboxymethylaminomethyl modifying GTPase MnmE/TrmE
LQGGSNQKTVLVANKIDLATDLRLPPDCLRTSAITSEGIAELIAAVVRELIPDKPEPGTAVPFTQRQVTLLDEAARNLIGDEPAEAINCLGRIALGTLPDLPPGAAIW